VRGARRCFVCLALASSLFGPAWIASAVPNARDPYLLRSPDNAGVNLACEWRNLDQPPAWTPADPCSCADLYTGPGFEGGTAPDAPRTYWALLDYPDGLLRTDAGPYPAAANRFELAASVLAASSGLLLFRRRP
jgi:hypothetical protein